MTRLLDSDNKYKIILILILSFIVVFTLGIVTISVLDFEEKPNGVVATVIHEGELTINYIDGEVISFNDNKEHSYNVSLTNKANKNLFYSIYLDDVNTKELNIKIYDEEDKLVNDIKNTSDKLINLYSVNASETVRYKIVLSRINKGKVDGKIKVVNESLGTEMFSDLILLNNEIVTPKTRIGDEVATTNEGLIETSDNKGLSYYFRGNVENNYVKLDNMFFRIVRINGDNSVRLVYDGVLNTKVAYNTNTLLEGQKANSLVLLNNASIMNTLNSWYKQKLIKYDSTIVKGDYCVDYVFSENVNNILYSDTYRRLVINKDPELYCKGNIFSNKIGLLSIDEVVFAGAAGDFPNTSYYLYNKDIPGNYLTSSSYFISNNNAAMMNVMSNGAVGDGILVGIPSYVRPVINIGVHAKVKGEGTKDNPYIIVS